VSDSSEAVGLALVGAGRTRLDDERLEIVHHDAILGVAAAAAAYDVRALTTRTTAELRRFASDVIGSETQTMIENRGFLSGAQAQAGKRCWRARVPIARNACSRLRPQQG
jgi:hypothetical protein